jgi:Ca-activated chloride channel family protein
MKINAQLDVDVVALQQDDEVTCLLTLEAPVPTDSDSRPGESLIVVVDRSGSMSGERLASVRQSLHALVDRVRPQDTFGVVTFDDTAAVAVPARAMCDHHTPTVHALVDGIVSGGMTDLTGGYLLGLAEARRHLGATGATVLLLSDGQANSGITDPLQVGALSAQARTERITTGTIGIGEEYDESLLAELSRQGNGPHRFAFTPDDAAAVIAEEAGDLLSKSAINAFVRITPADAELIEHITVMHDLPTWLEAGPTGGKVIVVALGDLYAGEHRELLLRFGVPSVDALGLRDLATLTIDYVALPALEAHSVTWPVAVNVVPGDEAAGRVPDPTVHWPPPTKRRSRRATT